MKIKTLAKYGIILATAMLAISLASCTDNGTKKVSTALSKYSLKGDVASIRQITYALDTTDAENAINKKTIERGGVNQYVEFNSFGEEVKIEKYDQAGNTVSSTENKFDSKGNIISTSEFQNGKPGETTSYFYSKGRLDSIVITKADGSIRRTSKVTYPGNDTTKTLNYDEKGKYIGYDISVLDDKGYETTTASYTFKNNLISEFKKTYDDNENLIRLESESIFFGKLTSEMTYNADYTESSIKMSNEHNTSSESDFKYKLDDHGNWTTRTCYKKGSDKPHRMEVREITYR